MCACARATDRQKTDRRRQKAGSEQYQGRKLGKGEEKLTERDGGWGVRENWNSKTLFYEN